MLNAVEENIRWWTPQKGDTGVDDFQLVQYDGGEIHHYTVLSSKVEHGKGIWTVGLIGTEQTRNWDARQMAHALEAAQIDKEGTGSLAVNHRTTRISMLLMQARWHAWRKRPARSRRVPSRAARRRSSWATI
jgi:hypothetical protein